MSNESMANQITDIPSNVQLLLAENQNLKSQNKILLEAVEFYADTENWEEAFAFSEHFVCKDPNFVAEKALVKIKEMER